IIMAEQKRGGRIFYGWYMVAALATTVTVSYGILLYAFSVFITPIEAEMGWSRAEITGALSLGFLVWGGVSIPVGNWLDKYGARALMSIGAIAATLLIWAWALVTDLTTFYLIWFGLGITMSMLFYDPAFTLIAKWFKQYRNRALTIVALAGGFASTIFLPLTTSLMEAYGWRVAVLILGAIVGMINIPLHVLVLRRFPADMNLYVDGASEPPKAETGIEQHDSSIGEALRNSALWWMIVAFSLILLSSSAIRVHFIPLLLDRGFDATFAAWIAGFIGVMQVIGRFIFIPLEKRMGIKQVTLIVFGLQLAVLFILLLPGTGENIIMFFVAVFGTSAGMSTLIRPSLLADIFGTAQYGRINSVMAFFMILALTVAPVGAGILYEQSGDYQSTIIFAIILTGLALLALLRVSINPPTHIETSAKVG
ncbi:MAG: MFS transporter, partial [Aggregatilineales bacterium]